MLGGIRTEICLSGSWMPKYNIIMTEPNVLVDSGNLYELYRHMALWADHYALVYRATGILSDNVTIERIEDDD